MIALHLDSEDQLWASTPEGLYRADTRSPGIHFQRMSPPGSTSRTMFFRFYRNARQRLWVGSTSGLFRFDHGTWMRFSTADGLKSDSVTHITGTPDGSIWIAYREPIGIARLTFTRDTFRAEHVSTRDGLPTAYALFLGIDRGGRLWVGTDNGVALSVGGKWRVYTHEDGLVWNDCAANSFLAEPNGDVWIGSLKGLSRFRPGSTPPIVLPLPAAITSIRFGDRPADPAAYHLQVPFRNRDFLVTFSALSFLSEKKARFRYRLAGLDDHGVEAAQPRGAISEPARRPLSLRGHRP